MSTGTARAVIHQTVGMAASDGAGVSLTRVIGQPTLDMLDPFLMLDEFGSDQPQDYLAGFPDHPHRGFETVTYMLAGKMRHADNHGHGGVIEPGGVQWMTAGRGIVHSEMPEQEEGLLRGFQLWINLPARDKMKAPFYQEFPTDQIPEDRRDDGVVLRMICGTSAGGVEGPVRGIPTDPIYADMILPAGGHVAEPVPGDLNAFLYVYEGAVEVAGETATEVGRGHIAILGPGDRVELTAAADGARLLLLAARPIGEPVARAGPFVMNTREELIQAFDDMRAGRF